MSYEIYKAKEYIQYTEIKYNTGGMWLKATLITAPVLWLLLF